MNIQKHIYRFISCMGFMPLCSLLAQSSATEKPNIVIILADDMGYGDVSYNNPLARTKTPNIDQLANQGITFSDAHAGAAVSIPSRYGLLTGRYYFRVEQQKSYWGYLSPLIEPGRETIGTLLQKAGYTTACIGKWHLGLSWNRKDNTLPQVDGSSGYTNTDFTVSVKDSPNDHGFNYSFIIPASLDMPPYVFLRNGKIVDSEIVIATDIYPRSKDGVKKAWDSKNVKEDDIYWGRGVWWRNGEMSASFRVENCLDEITNEGINFIEGHVSANNNQPFMLYLPLTGPHMPWMPGKFTNTSEMGIYGDNIAHIDDVVFRINETLKRLNIDENTIVIFSSDNGAPWQEEDIQKYGHRSNGQWRGQKGDVWEGGHHVPLFIKWPAKIKQQQTYNYTVSLIDFITTFADLTHQKIDNGNAEDSFSFWSVLNGNIDNPIREYLVYISSHGKLAIKSGDWKLIDNLGSGGFSSPAIVEPLSNGPLGQLYHIGNDPSECNNLYLRNEEKVNELSNLLQQIILKK